MNIPAPMPNGIAMTVPTICVDFDGTLYPWGPLMDTSAPIPGAVEAIQALRGAGYQVVIFTSRLSRRWLKSAGQTYKTQYWHIVRTLRRDDIPFSLITAEKVPADFYLDDRAIQIDNNWRKVAAAILARGAREVAAP